MPNDNKNQNRRLSAYQNSNDLLKNNRQSGNEDSGVSFTASSEGRKRSSSKASKANASTITMRKGEDKKDEAKETSKPARSRMNVPSGLSTTKSYTQSSVEERVNERRREREGNSHKNSNTGVIAVLITFMVIIVGSIIFVMAGSSKPAEVQSTPVPTKKVPTPTTNPDAAVLGSLVSDVSYLAVVLSVDPEARLITVYDVENRKNVVLTYTGASVFYMSYGSQATATQLEKGDLLQFKCIESEGRILSAAFTEDVWTKKVVDNLAYFPEDKNEKGEIIVTFDGQSYRCSEDVLILSNGERKTFADLLLSEDKLTVKGVGTRIYEIIVTTGHGTLQLANFSDFIDGTIYIGSRYALAIDNTGSYTLREGEYRVKVQKGKYKGEEVLTVYRDRTTVFDVFDYGTGPIQYGNVQFTISPDTAALYIDGVRTDYKKPVKLEYGAYKIEVECDGYESLTTSIVVDEAILNRDIYLTKVYVNPGITGGTDTGDGDSNENGTTQNTSSTSLKSSDFKINSSYAIYIRGPVGATIMLENDRTGEVIEIGTAPVDFEKVMEAMKIIVTYTNDKGDTQTKIIPYTDYDLKEDVTYDFSSNFTNITN